MRAPEANKEAPGKSLSVQKLINPIVPSILHGEMTKIDFEVSADTHRRKMAVPELSCEKVVQKSFSQHCFRFRCISTSCYKTLGQVSAIPTMCRNAILDDESQRYRIVTID